MEQKLACPSCGSTSLNEILYGFPSEEPGPGQVLGGCIVGPRNPDYQCANCGHRFQTRVKNDADF